MLSTSTSATPWGIDARAVEIEIDVQMGLPQVQIVGLADVAVREGRERVRSAIRNCGFDLPPRSVTINLAPVDLRKQGNHLDLAIATARLVAHGHLPEEHLKSRLPCGELGLDGTIRTIRGGLAIADLAARLGCKEVILPAANAAEAAALGCVPVVPVHNLAETVAHLRGETPISAVNGDSREAVLVRGTADLAEVRGQEGAKRALEIAAACGHNLLMLGPPDPGKK